jgi:catalase
MEADRGYPQAASAHDTFWDFISLMPESTHMIMWAMSDRTIPRSLRTIEGFGVHTFRLVNAAGKSTFVKFHWKPKQGVASTIWDEAVKIAGADPDFHRRDLFEAIQRGDFPEWELGIQAFDQAFADSLPFDVLDPTKIIPEEVLPVRIVGRMVLDRYPDNFFAETEQVAYCPANVPPGIDFTNDPLLQGRLFSYLDTQKSRLGTANFHQIPINAPKCPVMNFQRDGQMQMLQPKGRANYEPNSLSETAGEDRRAARMSDDRFHHLPVRRSRERAGRQAAHPARQLRRPLQPGAAVLPLAGSGRAGPPGLGPRVRAVEGGHRGGADADDVQPGQCRSGPGQAGRGGSQHARAEGVEDDGPVQDLDLSPALRIVNGPRAPTDIKGHVIGVLVADGSDAAAVDKLKAAIKKAGAVAKVIAPKIGGAKGADGTLIPADGQLAGTPSVTVDAIALVLSDTGCAALLKEAAAVQFVMDAFGHLKAIGATDAAKPLLDKAGVEPDEGVVGLGADFIAAAAKRFWDREPQVRTLA